MSIMTFTTLSVTVNAGRKTVQRPLRIAADGRPCVSYKGHARPITPVNAETGEFDPTTADKIALETTRAAKVADLAARNTDAPHDPAPQTPAPAAAKPVDQDDDPVATLAKLERVRRAQAGKVAKNPDDEGAAKALATLDGRIATLTALVNKPAPQTSTLTVDSLADKIAATEVDLFDLITALAQRAGR